ncbi:hypothetical protein V6N13_029157 [Hibiscus sabdariffa]
MEKLSHMGFHPDVEDVQLNLKLDPKDSFVHAKERERLTLRSSEEVRDLAINSLWEDVESGSRKTKDPWAKAIDENFNEGFSNVFGDNVSRPLLENHSDGESGLVESQKESLEIRNEASGRPFVGDFKTGLHRGLQKRTFDCVSGCVGSTVFGRG